MASAEARFSNSLRPRKPEGSLGRTAQDVHLDSHTAPELFTRFGFYVALRPRRRDDLFRDGTEWEGDRVIGSTAEPPEKTGETVDRRQNNGSVKRCPLAIAQRTCALCNCSFNCCAGQSH